MTTEERAVVDRIVNDLAVILVGDEEDEHHIPVAQLPEGAGEGTWLRVGRTDAGLTTVGVDAEGGRRQRDQLDRRMDRIRRQRGGGRFPR